MPYPARAVFGRGAGRLVPVTVTSGTPLTITLPDGSSLRAVGLVGLAYPTSGKFIAYVEAGRMPLVFPIGTTTDSGNIVTG